MRYLIVSALLCAAAEPTSVPPEAAAVVQIDNGCTGVCVHPDGIILSADHCGSARSVTFENEGRFSLDTLYDPPQDGVDQALMFKCQHGANLPYVEIAEQAPRPGDEVYSIGYPSEERAGRKWSMFRGRITHTHYTHGTPPAADGIRVDFPVWGGNSGGPLFNASGELVGLCSTSDRNSVSTWVGPEDIRATLSYAGGVRIGPPLEIEFGENEPIPDPPIEYGPTPLPPAPFPTPQPVERPAVAIDTRSLIMIVASTAASVLGLPWLPRAAQLLLGLFGMRLSRKQQETRA